MGSLFGQVVCTCRLYFAVEDKEVSVFVFIIRRERKKDSQARKSKENLDVDEKAIPRGEIYHTSWQAKTPKH